MMTFEVNDKLIKKGIAPLRPVVTSPKVCPWKTTRRQQWFHWITPPNDRFLCFRTNYYSIPTFGLIVSITTFLSVAYLLEAYHLPIVITCMWRVYLILDNILFVGSQSCCLNCYNVHPFSHIVWNVGTLSMEKNLPHHKPYYVLLKMCVMSCRLLFLYYLAKKYACVAEEGKLLADNNVLLVYYILS